MMKIYNLPNTHRALLITGLAALFALSACQEQGSAEKAGKKIDQATEKTEKQLDQVKEIVVDKAEVAEKYVDDALITTKIKEALIADSFLKASKIEITTVNGVVDLQGDIASEQLSARMEGLVKTLPGVKSVNNHLLSKPSAVGQ